MTDSAHILVVDNYDSFVYTIVGYLQTLGATVDVVRNDAIDPAAPGVLDGYDGVLISPGPGAPAESGASEDMIRLCAASGVPMFGVCLGLQALAEVYGCTVDHAPTIMHGKTSLVEHIDDEIFDGVANPMTATRYHSLAVEPESVPDDLVVTAWTQDDHIVQGIKHRSKPMYAVQFHPEVLHTAEGKKMLRNFVYNVCGCSGDWKMDSFVENNVKALRERIGEGKVLCALSGGVDSSVLAAMLAKAIGKQLTCVFVDHGLLRKNEKEEVCSVFGPGNANGFDINFICVDARDRYFSKLKGVTEPERKRKIIGEKFIRTFEKAQRQVLEEAGARGKEVKFLVQGTLYPDVVESGGGDGAANIKSHHNVGGLPKDIKFQLIEPLRTLFKDEVRAIGTELGLPDEIVWRQPFPGPGLGIRIIGEITRERLDLLREADAIAREELSRAGLDRDIWQCPVVLLADVHSVGVQGDERTYGSPIVLRPVSSEDAMTADWSRVPYDVLATISTRITNECRQINRVVLDCTSKPPATIEWE